MQIAVHKTHFLNDAKHITMKNEEDIESGKKAWRTKILKYVFSTLLTSGTQHESGILKHCWKMLSSKDWFKK